MNHRVPGNAKQNVVFSQIFGRSSGTSDANFVQLMRNVVNPTIVRKLSAGDCSCLGTSVVYGQKN